MKLPELGRHWPKTKIAVYICNGWPHCSWRFWPNHGILRGFSRHVFSSLIGIQYYSILETVLQVDQLVDIHNHALSIKSVKGMLNIMILKTLYKQHIPFTSKRRKTSFRHLELCPSLPFSCWMFYSPPSFVAFIHGLSSFSFGA